jgi:2-dehydro-3-deoxyphosphogluconate aldolase/(4S)-4-hydroxy-2-oxoglutarate aldolase
MNQSLLERCRVLPVITAHDVDTTVQLARTLLQGGMHAVEITLRTDAALDCIRAVKADVPELLVAAGTITNPDDMSAALMAGADFCVSPGLTKRLLCAASEAEVYFVPGVATASEILLGMDYGFQCFKLFPAVGLGGINFLKHLAGPFPGVRFCPTGGLTPHNFQEFLDLPNVVCCGGSWMVANSLISVGNWDEIARLAGEVMAGAK